jgi:heme-degrading monooxygenase HmoA
MMLSPPDRFSALCFRASHDLAAVRSARRDWPTARVGRRAGAFRRRHAAAPKPTSGLERYPAGPAGGSAMPDIQENSGIVTQITTVRMTPENQDEVINLMKERARFMAKQPGFVSVSLHRSQDGSHVVNYVQWANKDKLAAAHHSPEFRKKWPRFGELAKEIEPCLYDVVNIEAA